MLKKYQGHVIDFMPTFIEAANGKYRTGFAGNAITPLAGTSLLPAMQGREVVARQVLYNEHFGARMVREGDWKLVSKSADAAWHFYYLANDGSETNDLAGTHPEIVAQLKGHWEKWAEEHPVLPKGKQGAAK